MPVFNNYSADGKLLGTAVETLNEKNIERYIAEHGEEKAKVYLEALADFTRDMQEILDPPNSGRPQTPHLVRTNLNQYVRQKSHFLELFVK